MGLQLQEDLVAKVLATYVAVVVVVVVVVAVVKDVVVSAPPGSCERPSSTTLNDLEKTDSVVAFVFAVLGSTVSWSI